MTQDDVLKGGKRKHPHSSVLVTDCFLLLFVLPVDNVFTVKADTICILLRRKLHSKQKAVPEQVTYEFVSIPDIIRY